MIFDVIFTCLFPRELGLSLPGSIKRFFEETEIRFVLRKPLPSSEYVFVMKTRPWSRRWSSEVQGLIATNPEGDSKMDVIGIVPSVSFEPERLVWMNAFRTSSRGR